VNIVPLNITDDRKNIGLLRCRHAPLKQKLLRPSVAALGFRRWMIQVNCMLHDIKNVDPLSHIRNKLSVSYFQTPLQ